MYNYSYKNFDFPSDLKKIQDALNAVKNDSHTGMKLIRETPPYENQKELKTLQEAASHIRDNFEHLVIVGMGGSILNPAAVLELESSMSITCLDTIDPEYVSKLANQLDLSKTCFLFISKSGNTIEVIALLDFWIQKLKKSGIDCSKNFIFILGENPESKIRKMASEIGSTILKHDSELGGRYSSFTNICTLPLMIQGRDVDDFYNGANEVLKDFKNRGIESEVVKGGMFLADMHNSGKNIVVAMSYAQKLSPFLEWQKQIIGESLGKDGIGITPVSFKGPLDQHSQIQLYLDGPEDKFYTMIHANNMQHLHTLEGHTLHSIITAEYNATAKALIDNKLPIRTIALEKLDLRSLGALMMHTMVETIIAGYLLGINPFDQSAVEEVKRNIRTFLKNP